MRSFLRQFAENECGATSIEYGLIAAFIGIVIVTGAQAIGTGLNDIFTNVKNGFP